MATNPRGRPARNPDEFETFPELDNGMGLTTQLVWVTKDIALKWMSRPGAEQRGLIPEHLDAIKRELLEGRWLLNGSPIVLDHEEKVLTGRHRLTAVIESGIPMLILIVRGVPPEAYGSINQGAKNRPSSVLQAAGYKNANHLGAAARMLKRYEMSALKGMDTPRNIEMLATAAKEKVDEHSDMQASYPKIVQAAKLFNRRYYGALIFCHYILADIDADFADDFFEKFASGEDMHRGHPILAMRNYVIQGLAKNDGKVTGEDLPIIIFKTWNLCRMKKTAIYLRIEVGEKLQQPI